MQHLETERIAAFDHEPPTVDELAHLAACGVCRTERTALLELSQMAMHAVTDGVPNMPRLTTWESLSSQLRAEGLLTSAPLAVDVAATSTGQFAARHSLPSVVSLASRQAERSVSSTDTHRAAGNSRPRAEWWRVAAAALLLVAGGGVVGRMSADASSGSTSSVVNSADVLGGIGGLGSTGFSSLAEANKALARAQTAYEKASLWVAANDTAPKSPALMRTRLAALDQMVVAARTGLKQAPQDPLLNHYYFAAYTMREATLRQLGGALPVGRSIERF